MLFDDTRTRALPIRYLTHGQVMCFNGGMTTYETYGHKQANQAARAQRLVTALDGLGGDLQTTLKLAESMKPAQWDEFAVNVVDMTPPSTETVGMAIGILRTRVRAEAEQARKGSDPFACFPSTPPTLGVVR